MSNKFYFGRMKGAIITALYFGAIVVSVLGWKWFVGLTTVPIVLWLFSHDETATRDYIKMRSKS